MSIPRCILQAKGSWFGTSKLNLPWLAPEKRVTESGSFLHVETDAHDAFATVTYTWEHEGKRHEGTMVIAMNRESKEVQVGWADSWHQSTGIMHTVGLESDEKSFKTKGTYAADKEVWGWTIDIAVSGDTLVLKMDNVPPQGGEWAVEAIYRRS